MSTQRQDTWTGGFAAKKLRSSHGIVSVDELTGNTLEIERKKHGACIVGTIAVPRLTENELRRFLDSHANVVYVGNIKKDAVITGKALRLAAARGVGVGSFGNLFSAVEEADPSAYVDRETAFITRCLRQHSRVKDWTRLDDRRYRIERRGLPYVTAVFLNEYELSAEHVRNAIDAYGDFDAIVAKNPYGEPSSAAVSVALQAGRKMIQTWSDFLGELNRRWT